MKIMIVGGAGFIGTSIANAFHQKGYEVYVIDSRSRISRNKDLLNHIKTLEMDFPHINFVLLEQLFCKKDVLVHLACTTNPSKSMHDIKYDAESNILPSIELFSLAVRKKLSKIIFASSGGTVYGSVQSTLISETCSKKPICAYGASKLAIENYLSLMTFETPVSGISLRIGNPYGAYQLQGTTIGAVAAFINATINERPINIWGDGETVRDYLYIDDLVSAFIYATELENICGSYNIGTGLGYSLNEVIEYIKKTTNLPAEVCYHKNRGFDVPKIVLDPTKFINATQWRAKINLNDGIFMLINQFITHLKI